jgi:hypothetical protein
MFVRERMMKRVEDAGSSAPPPGPSLNSHFSQADDISVGCLW